MKDLLMKPLRHYGRFRGRSGRAEFWAFVGVQTLAYALLIIVFSGFGARLHTGEAFGHPLLWLLWLGLLTPNLALSVRRLHDLNLSGLWAAVPWVVALIGGVTFNLMLRASDQRLHDGDIHDVSRALGSMVEVMAGTVVYIVLPFIAAQVVLLGVAALPGTQAANRFGNPPRL